MNKKIIIIGAGIAGLSAGCYGQMNGYDTEIFEMHNLPGGLCTAWKRGGYTFDLSIKFLLGSAPGVIFYKIWNELGALQDKQFVNHEEFIRYEKSGQIFIMYNECNRFEKHLMELAPEDDQYIREFISDIRKLANFPIFQWGKNKGFKTIINAAKVLPIFAKHRRQKKTVSEFAANFKNPFLRDAFTSTMAIFPELPLLALKIMLAWHHNGYTGYPIGGSLAFAQSIEKRYLSLGGKIHYQAKVAEILVENNRAVGIRLTNGDEYCADSVISAADGYTTIFKMLAGKYLDDKLKRCYKEWPLFYPIIKVSLGVNRDLSNEPYKICFELEKPIRVVDRMVNKIICLHYCYDPTMAPAGKSVITVEIETDYDFWEKLAQDQVRYREQKQQIADTVIVALDQRFPGLAGQVEVVDVATPVTFNRYTNNWRGSWEGWLMTSKTMDMFFMPKTLPGLANFYMVGQWVRPGGGLQSGAKTAREVVQTLCKKDRKKFSASLP